MKHGAEWYKREPTAYLGGVQGLTAREHAVYSIILDLIYQHGGAVNNDPAWFAGWIKDMGAAAVRSTIDGLILRGKLILEGDLLTNKRAKNQAKTKENLSENRAEIGKKGGISSGISRAASNKINEIAEPIGSPREDKRREEIKEEGKPSSKKDPRRCRLPEGWIPSPRNIADAHSQQFTDEEIDHEGRKFRDYHHAKGTTFADWDAGWRTWVTNARKFAGPARGGNSRPGSGTAAAFAAVAARNRSYSQ